MNPLSGERSAADGLTRALLSILGQDRVLTLSASVFRDSSPISTRVDQGARRVAAAHPPGTFDGTAPARRMSVLVAGGDGTVSFVIGALEAALSDPLNALNGVMPAITIIPMGTGNDLSNAMGYGLGFTTNKLCCCCVCCPNDVDSLLRAGLGAPVVAFDRWNATVYRVDNQAAPALRRAAAAESTNPACVLQQRLGGGALNANDAGPSVDLLGVATESGAFTPFQPNFAASGMYSTAAEWARTVTMKPSARNSPSAAAPADSQPSSLELERVADGGGGGSSGAAEAATASSSSSSSPAAAATKLSRQQSGVAKPPSAASAAMGLSATHPRLAAAAASAGTVTGDPGAHFVPLASFDFNNYFSFGLDAAVVADFDEKRKAYPSCHTYRLMNKVWYGYHGIAMALDATPLTNDRVSVACDRNEVFLSRGQNNCRAFVITNISSYSGGVDLWSCDKPCVEQQPATAAGSTRDVTYHPTSVSDGMLEAVSIGGFWHMAFLRSGVVHGDRVAQGSHMTFVLGDFAESGALAGRAMAFQVDGEPAGTFDFEPGALVIDIRLHSRAFFHKVPLS